MFSTKITVTNLHDDQTDFWATAGRTLGGPLVVAALRAHYHVVDVAVNRRLPSGTFVVITDGGLVPTFDQLAVGFGKRVADPVTGTNSYVVFQYDLKVEIA